MVISYKGVGRNDPCPCGSGKKFKKCCLDAQRLNEPSSELDPLSVLDPFETEPGEVAWSALARAEGAPPTYDPLTEPHLAQWLALDEQEQIDVVLAYHRRARIRLPRAKLHATIHVVVENQMIDARLPVRRVLQRLMSEGLDRHNAIHAIGSVLVAHINDLVKQAEADDHRVDATSKRDPNADYFAELETLTAQDWRRSG